MLTPRNFIGLTIAIAVFSILSACWSMLQPPDSGGLRADTYGTRGNGYRALYETFQELDVPVRRLLGPPRPESYSDSLLVLWSPRKDLINADPVWLKKIQAWLRNGGQAVVAYDNESTVSLQMALQRLDADDDDDSSRRRRRRNRGSEYDALLNPPSLFELLGLGELPITRVDEVSDDSDAFRPANRTASKEFPSDADMVDVLKEVFTDSSRQEGTELYAIQATGDFADTVPSGTSIELPVGYLYSINTAGRDVADALYAVTEEGERHCIAARLPVGEGNVTVVSTRRLISNANVGSADNILVTATLLLESGKEIVFDEFYHGVTIRGNPMWLFSRRTYGSVAVMLLLFLGIAIWRAAVFLGPPVAEAPVQRRSIREYIHAMSRFLREGKGYQHWSLEHVRDGILWKLRREFGLPPESRDDDRLTTAMARKDPARAEELTGVLKEVNTILSMPGSAGERRIGQLIERMTACLSKTDTMRSEPRSPK